MAYGLSLHPLMTGWTFQCICTNTHMQHCSICHSLDTSVWKKKIHTLSNWKTGSICHYQQHIIWSEWEESYITTVAKNCMYGSEYTLVSVLWIHNLHVIGRTGNTLNHRPYGTASYDAWNERKLLHFINPCNRKCINDTNNYKQALLLITMHMDTEPTKNNLLFMVARTWLGHLSFPRWLLSFVYPHTSWMLIVDSFLVCTNEGGKNSTLLWEAAAWCRRTKSRIRGGPVFQYSQEQLWGGHMKSTWDIYHQRMMMMMCISTPLPWGFLCYPVMQLLPQLQHTCLPWIEMWSE